MDPEYSNKPVVIMEDVNERLFKHNSEVVTIQTIFKKHDHNSWLPTLYTREGYRKYRTTVPKDSMYIFRKYKARNINNDIQLAYDFKIPYLKFVDDMLKFRINTALITKLAGNSKPISYIYYNKAKQILNIHYDDDEHTQWVYGEFKKQNNEISIAVEYTAKFKVS